MTNQVILQMAKDFKKASKKNDAPIWGKLAEYALKPSQAKITVNLKQIDQHTKENDIAAVPGKVLGIGNISHKISLYSFSISNSAATKILDAGGKIINYSELIEKSPTGKGVVLLG